MQTNAQASSHAERLSAFVDGELLDGEHPNTILAALGHEDRAAWSCYHLIGDALRSDDLAVSPATSSAFLTGFSARFESEAHILAPAAVPATRRLLALRRRVIPAFAVAAAAAVYVGRQVKKPTRFVGRLFAWLMNSSHSALTDWALTHVRVDKDAKVLDVGCGGGRTIEKLAEMANLVYGIDYAAGSIAAAHAHNKRLIAEGRVLLERASVSRLPFADDFFELVTQSRRNTIGRML